jgi:DNA polymerase-1
VSVSEAPAESTFEPVAAAPAGDRWCIAVSEDEVHLSDELPGGPVRIHDAKSAGIPGADFDTYLAAYLIKPGLGSYEPETLAQDRGLPEISVEHEDVEVAEACRRAALVFALAPMLDGELEDMGLKRLYYEVELPLAEVLWALQRVGMPVDASTLEAVGEDLNERLESLESRIYEEAGQEFNIGSPKQLGKVLFEDMNITPIRKTKTGFSTDAKVLEQLRQQGYAIAELIVEYREYAKLKGTYIEGLRDLITPEGRIHTTLNQTTTATGRISSDKPNLQNIPVRTEMGARIRNAFTASTGRKLVIADYSQIELRILAHMTQEPALIESFTTGEDVHTRTASEVFDVPLEEVTSELRGRAKMVNFGILYGISGFGLATRLGNVDPAEADQYIKRYLERYPKVTEFIQETIDEAEELGYSTTLFGRRRYVPELRNSNKNVRKLGERIAFNARVQGTAADIIKVAMVDLYPRLKSLDSDMLMQVHDELVFDVAEDRVGQVAKLAVEKMVAAYDLHPPLEVEAKVGERWGRLKEFSMT